MELHAGHHTVIQLLGLNVNIDTLIMTWMVAALVIVVTLFATRGRAMVPSGAQNAMEMVVEALLDQFKESLGPKYGQVVSVLLTMFLFILFANEFGLLPNPGVLSSPTNDLNTTVAYRPFWYMCCTSATKDRKSILNISLSRLRCSFRLIFWKNSRSR